MSHLIAALLQQADRAASVEDRYALFEAVRRIRHGGSYLQQMPPAGFTLGVQTIPHQQHPYETVGFWTRAPNGSWRIDVSRLDDWRYEYLVALHELVEMALCVQRGITEEAVTAFDVAYEATRLDGDTSEPGDNPDAPYVKEHAVASTIERLVAGELGVDWDAYEVAVSAL